MFGHLAHQLIASGLLGSMFTCASVPHFGHVSVIAVPLNSAPENAPLCDNQSRGK
jgi:hypothetical protein